MLQLVLGPMFSGKTSELLRRLIRSKIANKRVLLVRPKIDDRGFLTHDRKQVERLEEVFVENLADIFPIADNYDVIGIDEGQFFGDIFPNADILADKLIVIVSGLNGTSEKHPFKGLLDLVPLSDTIDKLNAICTCCGSEYGSFTYYTKGEKKGDVLVGGSDAYTALCRKCYNNKTK